MKKTFCSLAFSIVISIACVGAAMAQGYEFSGSTAFGSASGGGNTVVGTSSNGGYSTINFDVPTGTTLADLDTLSTEFSTPDGCAGGSPRFTVTTVEGSYYDFFINCSGPVATLTSTGDLTSGNVDVRGANGYKYQVSFASIQAQFGAETIKSIALIVDGSWSPEFDGSQQVTFDNVNIDGTTYTFEAPGSSGQCKNNNWRIFTDANGDALYRNQGQCVSYFASGGKSGGKNK